MTQKEKLYREFVIAKNKLNALKGEALIGGDNIEEYFNSYDFSNRASHHTKKEIQNMIDYAKYCYESEVERMRVEEYFNTEEGSALKENLLNEMVEIKEERVRAIKENTDKLDETIKKWLGENWGCGRLINGGGVEIGIVKEVTDGYNHFHFGHTFNLYFDKFYRDTERFEMNYGCMGSFELLNCGEKENLRAEFLRGMATFATDKGKLYDLKKFIDTVHKQMEKMSYRMDELKRDLENPFIKLVNK